MTWAADLQLWVAAVNTGRLQLIFVVLVGYAHAWFVFACQHHFDARSAELLTPRCSMLLLAPSALTSCSRWEQQPGDHTSAVV
jgi:hypothetical protein